MSKQYDKIVWHDAETLTVAELTKRLSKLDPKEKLHPWYLDGDNRAIVTFKERKKKDE